MLKMQLPLKKAEEGEETAEDEKEQSGLFPELAFTAASGRLLQEPTEEPGAPFLTKESVYEWFGLHLSPAKRIEFMYGLLHMCQPLELRFLGSCLEDLARKDFHVLRDFEIRANSSSDLGLLTDVTDPVARSKLLVCLSLLGSDNRECAGILFRILSHVDPALLLVSSYPGSQAFDAFRSLSGDSDEDGTHNCGGFEPFVESRAGLLEQLAVLFTMASLHPAFLFHQRGKLRMQLEKLEQDLIQRQNRRQCVHHNTHAPPQGQPECHFTNSQVNANEKTQTHNLAPAHPSRRAEREGKAHAVHIEKIVLKGISRGKTEREYSFEVKWSDMSTSSITKTHLEMKNFLFQLPKEHSTDSFERSILQLLSQKNEGREVEQSLKEKFLSAPHAFRQTGKVCGFFHCGSLSSPSLSCSRRKPYKEDCSEASSQEEDMEPYVQEHRKKPGNKSPGLNMRSSEGKRTDHGSDNNNLTEWRKKSCTLKPICTQYTKPAGGEGENSSTKPKARSATSDCSEKRERGIGRVPFVSNGVMSLPSPRPHQPKGKDLRKMESLSVANTSFALDLFKKIREGNKQGNMFYSPLSISSALAMVSLGAAGNTEAQMSETLQFNKAKVDIHIGFNQLLNELNKAGAPYSLTLANRLYGEQTYQFVEKFLGDTKQHYSAELEAVDFKSNAEAARVKINKWVEKQTQEKITDLLAKGVVDELTRLVLVNAIYFKGSWEKKFNSNGTREVPFRLNKKDTKPVQMMNQKAKFPLAFIPDMNCQILEMPYAGKDLSMLIILPTEMADDTTGLEKIEKNLTYENLMEWTRPDMMDNVEVQVSLPRFKLEDTYDMKGLLVSMGMVDAFDRVKCDFSRMSPCDDLVLSKVVHKSFVEVNEEGTEAAAATAAIMMMRCAMLPPERFVADHPFLFFIRHNATKSILFCGRFSSP
ncbi:zinc finger CCHC domain-containing protein 2 isoform X7 [Astyanax mexicanus]|uniref:zinc finger CCHC domain-containing protein 2 isoform X7 n=1 Tax=Astyanax mexicanus TaxID=7994 RepID=UPI0020CB635A|nr:zinc finger CCHC domain-containing protein 2 isoform X7 [Astyanax mexicanus]